VLLHRAALAGQLLRDDPELAHLVYAGSDMVVMPSMYEPCGLTQLITARYGTMPIVRAI
jgi:starch synthase